MKDVKEKKKNIYQPITGFISYKEKKISAQLRFEKRMRPIQFDPVAIL